jgi:hypothetical protein
LDFLLETIGFPPGEATHRWMAAQARRGGHRRVPVGPGMAVVVERGVHDGPLALRPSLIGGSRLELEVAEVRAYPGTTPAAEATALVPTPPAVESESPQGIQGVMEARLTPADPWRKTETGLALDRGDTALSPSAQGLRAPQPWQERRARLDGNPRAAQPPLWPDRAGPWSPAQGSLQACLVAEPGAERGPLSALPRTGQRAWFELAGFALDVEALGDRPAGDSGQPGFTGWPQASDPALTTSPALLSSQPLTATGSGSGQLRAIRGQQAPLGCVELLLPIRSIKKQINHLTGRLYERIEADLGADSLTLFVSRWQLERDRLPRPQPGAWIRGVFWLEARLLPGLRSG